MSNPPFRFHCGAIHLPELGLWMDPHEPVIGPERVFVSHAHSDHTAQHREVILTGPTSRLMRSRIGGDRLEHVLDYRKPMEFPWDSSRYEITLLPAGHIYGSAMAFVEWDGHSLLYTGDFKTRRSRSAEPCDPSPARGVDLLIMETTYGRPAYQFPPTVDVLRAVIRFCRESIDNDELPVLLGYSLGKSQELLSGLADAGLPIMLHGSVERLTRVYEELGQRFPRYESFDPESTKGKVLICPPSSVAPTALRGTGRVRTAVLTGWAVDPGCRFRSRADAAFPMSDHADYSELIEFVKQVSPKLVYTLHGFAADFAATLRTLGFKAAALSENEQLSLPLALEAEAGPVTTFRTAPESQAMQVPEAVPLADLPPGSFAAFATTSAAIGQTPGKLEKVRLLAEYLRALKETWLPPATTWFTGQPFASSDNKVLKLGWAILRDALCAAAGVSPNHFRQVYLKHSDTGETAGELLFNVVAEPTLQLDEVEELFDSIHRARSAAIKLGLLTGALRRSTPIEARFLVKIITGDLRIGLKEGLVEEAVALAFEATAAEVRGANLLLGHIGQTALIAKQKALHTVGMEPFRPVKFMLASPEAGAEDVWQRFQGAGSLFAAREIPTHRAERVERAIWIEDKFDGIRCQLHKVGSRVALYSRDLKEITATFPELADAARGIPADLVLDGEILGMRDDVVLPFAELQKRLGRREGDLFLGDEIPVRLLAFDLLWIGGRSLLNDPLSLRRAELQSVPWPAAIRLTEVSLARSPEEIEEAFAAARLRQNEGLMAKDATSHYTPGRRGLAWLKLKKALATLDCVVVGAEYGHGRRKDVLSDYTFAVRDGPSGALKTIGKAYSGLTDDEISSLTRHFLRHVIRQRGRYHEVEPDTVLEIAFDRIQPSARHSSGLALRFPRIVRVRTDKAVDQIDTVASAWKLAGPAVSTADRLP